MSVSHLAEFNHNACIEILIASELQLEKGQIGTGPVWWATFFLNKNLHVVNIFNS